MSRPKQAVVALSLLTAVGVAGCTSSGSGATPSASPSVSGSSSASRAVVAPSIAPTHAQRAIPADSQIVETPALRRTITLTSCTAVTGGWAGAGTARNPSATAQTYRLLVFFTDRYSRTIDYARTDVRVPAGRTATWQAATKFTPPAGTQCVLRGLYAVKGAK